MKTAIYIEDGVVQLVLTPENEFEQNAVGSLACKEFDAKIMMGTFYDCQGGWTKHRIDNPVGAEKSLILRVNSKKP